MRVLALHGIGSCSTILKEQLTPLLKQLGQEYQVTYMDGAIHTVKGPGVPEGWSGPAMTYAADYTPAAINITMHHLHSFIQENGPFDGVFGFSLGASMVASSILSRQHQRNGDSEPFRFAVFFSSIAAFSGGPTCCEQVVERLVHESADEFRLAFSGASTASISSDGKIFTQYLVTCCKTALSFKAKLDMNTSFFESKHLDQVRRPIHPQLIADRIRIQTIHVMGSRDFPLIAEQSRALVGLCNDGSIKLHTRRGA
ncbi:hypothetical protein PG996_014085 [Apiospora saccharicola]|uniref:Serine hydrolase domain-containing protein n=1 Tax=Apiospora saccharicola TaxID=335842 RepID=A0ABR1THA6_9PEZI